MGLGLIKPPMEYERERESGTYSLRDMTSLTNGQRKKMGLRIRSERIPRGTEKIKGFVLFKIMLISFTSSSVPRLCF